MKIEARLLKVTRKTVTKPRVKGADAETSALSMDAVSWDIAEYVIYCHIIMMWSTVAIVKIS